LSTKMSRQVKPLALVFLDEVVLTLKRQHHFL